MDELVIDVAGLNKRFGDKHVVRDLGLQVRKGEIYGFLGPNGSGKTTSIRMLCGLLTPDSGSGTCLGLDVLKDSAAIKRQVGYMTQKFSLWDDLSIVENLDFVARMFGMADRREAVDRAIDELGLGGRRKQLAGTLSGGWKQRLALASCLLHRPRLLLLDEPTAGVDPKARRDFWEEIHRLSASGITILVSTHYMDEAERCHRLAYIAYGNLLASGTADEVVANCQLNTWEIAGDGIHGLAGRLRQLPGADLVASFGTTLHVSGTDRPRLAASLQALQKDTGLVVTPVAPSLEDAFIHLMQHTADPLGN
ncbi:ABC transporter ATP-binding protein [Zoogloea sp. LCSB751]|uniref:ABC transporter ATP-binding protein n=1 Tax=Zoogloea sp. LCSB751 TaxID=1965277 RepID=UPI000B49674E|nr:ABC transporter ATP-binding protein [Zoogloea sp. LCSB751]